MNIRWTSNTWHINTTETRTIPRIKSIKGSKGSKGSVRSVKTVNVPMVFTDMYIGHTAEATTGMCFSPDTKPVLDKVSEKYYFGNTVFYLGILHGKSYIVFPYDKLLFPMDLDSHDILEIVKKFDIKYIFYPDGTVKDSILIYISALSV